MKRQFVVLVLVIVALLGLQGPIVAASPKLHPSGFGEHSYAAWNGGEGLQDSTGSKDQALYFQKMTSTATFAAGIAVFRGFEGASTADVLPLEFWWQTDGHCGAGAPRFNLRVELPSGMRQTVFIGCAGMVPGDTAVDDQGDEWQQRTFAGPVPVGTVVSLAIVFDEGNDVGQGFVFLDNIRVGNHIWTSASDNGGGNNEITPEEAESILGEPLDVALFS